MKPGERKRCEACGKIMVGAVHPHTGKVAPILLDPVDDPDAPGEQGTGNILLFTYPTPEGPTASEVRYAVIASASMRIALRDLGVPLRLNHFADCPEAGRFHRN